jgi:hypothetical protein
LNIDEIPQELKDTPNWVCWSYTQRGGKKTKVPYMPETGTPAKANDPSTWTSFNSAVACMDRYDGVGFQFSNSPFVGIDIDHCIDANGAVSDDARKIVVHIMSYAEISPSGMGLHIIARADVTDGNGCRKGPVEVYPQGRYFTVTGRVFEDFNTIRDASPAVNALMERLRGAGSAPPPASASTGVNTPLDAPAIIELIRGSRQAFTFSALFDDGDVSKYGGDSSGADMALMNMLPFWTCGKKELMLEIFGMSALARRDKWQNRPDYRDLTIKKALADWNGECYGQFPQADPKRLENIHFPIVEVGKSGKLFPVALAPENVEYILRRLEIVPRLNLLTKELEITGGDVNGLSLDSAITEIRGLLHRNGLKLTKSDTWDLITRIGEGRPYSPVCEYLKKCEKDWDGQDHLNDLFQLFELDPDAEQTPEFCKLLLRRWLIGCVHAAFNRGQEAVQGVLILVGPQGVGKTRFLYTLVPVSDWATDGVTLNPSQKDDVLRIMRFWLVELGEFGETMKREKLDALKQFFTQKKDVLRKPYARGTFEYPRRTAFIGTVNDHGFLKDNTGDRRYWPIAVKHVDNNTDIDMRQVWGYVMHLSFTEKAPFYLTPDEQKQLEKMNQQYKFISAEERALLDSLDWEEPVSCWRKVTCTALCDELNFSHRYVRRVGRALQALALKDPRLKIPTNHMRGRLYRVPKSKNTDIF